MTDDRKPFHNPFGVLGAIRDSLHGAADLQVGRQSQETTSAASEQPGRAAKAYSRAVVRMERSGRGGKEVTVIEQLGLTPAERPAWLAALKSALGCGGSVEGDALMLQGDQRKRLPAILGARGVKKIVVATCLAALLGAAAGRAQNPASVPAPIVQGGQVLVLFPPGSPFLKADRVDEPEQDTMTKGVPGRIQSIVNIHNPSIEFHPADPGTNTGAVVILAAGGGHTTLNVGTEGADFVPFFYNYGVNTVILRNRLRRDGYNPLTDEVYDAQQAIRMVRAHAQEWNLDPHKIGIVGFSAGAELAAPAAVAFDDFDRANAAAGDPLAGVSSRPDFVGLVYPGPTPFARNAGTPIPKNAPPTFITCAGTDDAVHANWADQYFAAMLKARIPNVEMHIYGDGVHANGLKDRNDTPFGTWQFRFIDWFRDLGFLAKAGVETKAARDMAAHVAAPAGPGRGGQ